MASFVIRAVTLSQVSNESIWNRSQVAYIELLMSGTQHLNIARKKNLIVRKYREANLALSVFEILGYANRLISGKWLTESEYDELYCLAVDILGPVFRSLDSDTSKCFEDSLRKMDRSIANSMVLQSIARVQNLANDSL